MTKEQQACEQHFITHTTEQDDGESVVRLPTKMDPKQLGSSRLSAERRLHIFSVDWNKISGSVPLFNEEIQRTRSQGSSVIPRGDKTCYCLPIVQSSRK